MPHAAARPSRDVNTTHPPGAPGRAARWPCVVVGGGPAGLAAAAALERRGVRCVVLEQGSRVGHAWRGRYDRLRLNTSRFTSRLGGVSYPRGAGVFPSRDDVVSYLERFAQRQRANVRTGVRVDRIERRDVEWVLRTSAGDLAAPHVIVATGYARVPYLPSWPGRDLFGGTLLHSAEYRDHDAFRGTDVLVVGAGSSGMEIALDLADGGARRVRLAVRTPPNVLLRSVGGVPGDPLAVALARLPAHIADVPTRAVMRIAPGDLGPLGLPAPDEGPFRRLQRTGLGPAVVDRAVIRALRDGRIEVVAAVAALARDAVVLSGGRRIEADAIVAATGFRCGLEALVGHLDVLDERGVPRAGDGREARPGLRFVGFVPVPGQLRRMGVEARRAARGVARDLSRGAAQLV